jgi:glycosyltransferase AglD
MLGTGNAAVAATPTRTTAASPTRVSARSGLLADALAMIGLLVAAAAARYPYIYVVPRFRDETFNALIALRIYRGQEFPFTDIEAYIGAFFNYAVAAGMFIVGPTIYAARFVVTVFGVLTVGSTYLLGRELGGRVVGVIAALLMTTNGIHIAPMGHVAFSGSITPFFTTLAFWLLYRAFVRRSNASLVWGGFMAGMSMHTHPTIVAFLPGLMGWYLWRNLGALRTRWPYLAALAFVLAFSPMIVFNIVTGGESIRHAVYTASERPDYARGRGTALTPAAYLDRQQEYWLMLYGTLGGAVDERPSATAYLTDPLLLATAALTVAGVGWAAIRHRYRLPLWLLGSFALILPLFNANHYDVEYDGRYVVPLLPMFYACIGLLVVDTWSAARQRLTSSGARIAAGVSLALVVLGLAVAPTFSLARYYARGARAEPTNASLIRAIDEVKAALRPGDVVFLDNNLNDRRTEYASPWDEASTFRVMRYIMEFDRVPYEVVDIDETALADLSMRRQGAIVILSSGIDGKDTARLGEMIETSGLQTLDGRPPRPPRPADRYGLYRLDPAQTGTTAGRR